MRADVFPHSSPHLRRSGATRETAVRRVACPCRGGVVALALLFFPSLAPAQTSRLPPVIDALTAPLSDGELAGIGCLVGTVLASGTVVALAGGPGSVALALQGPLPPVRVLEGGAAMAFLVSSACYVGQALAPAVMLGWTTLTDMITPAAAGP